jgi:hypothetical protein
MSFLLDPEHVLRSLASKSVVKPKVRLVSWNKVLAVLRDQKVDTKEFDRLFLERGDTRQHGPSPPTEAEVAAVSEYLVDRTIDAPKTALKKALRREVSTQQAMGTVGRVFEYRLDRDPSEQERRSKPNGKPAPAKPR